MYITPFMLKYNLGVVKALIRNSIFQKRRKTKHFYVSSYCTVGPCNYEAGMQLS